MNDELEIDTNEGRRHRKHKQTIKSLQTIYRRKAKRDTIEYITNIKWDVGTTKTINFFNGEKKKTYRKEGDNEARQTHLRFKYKVSLS